MSHCLLSGNSSAVGGGAISLENGSYLHLTHYTVGENQIEGNSGAISMRGGANGRLDHCTVASDETTSTTDTGESHGL